MCLNNQKIAFVICANDQLYYEDCLWYITQLYVPDGYETDIIGITGAESMVDAYNVAMESSDAKYKVYLHQDVFIYHRGFIEDILRLFQTYEKLGMLGVVGGVNLPKDAVIWSAWNRGRTLSCNNRTAFELDYQQNVDKRCDYTKVDAVDGMLIATQYDIRWRDDLKLAWDFYDISQSLEFRRKGYDIGIPFQKKPWCMHDCGFSKLSHYDVDRKKILDEYRDFFDGKYIPLKEDEILELQEQIYRKMRNCLEMGDLNQAMMMRKLIGKRQVEHNNLQYAMNLSEIFVVEQSSTAGKGDFFRDVNGFDEMKAKYDRLKLIIRHMENDTNPDGIVSWLFERIRDGEISREAVWSISKHCVMDRDKIYTMIN